MPHDVPYIIVVQHP